MKSFFTPAAESYLLDWGLTFAIGGALFVIIGFVSGWIIWRNARIFKSELVGGDR